jgi:NTE family protein
MGTRKVAIACQGGGAHAAFTWGVLTEILRTKQAWDASADDSERFDIIAMSGTSAGGLCALAAWYGLCPNVADANCGTIDKAIERLDFLWTTFAATTPIEHAHNHLIQSCLRLKERGALFPEANPYDRAHAFALEALSMLGAREQYLGFPGLLEAVCPHFSAVDWPAVSRTHLRLLVGAVEVISGNFEVFDSEKTLHEMGLPSICRDRDQYSAVRWRMRRSLSIAGVAASGTLPEVLPAQKIEDLTFQACEPGKTVKRSGYYWDGLYSQNPPVRDLLDVRERDNKPDEIWVIRINPQEYFPENPDVELNDIHDRLNALAGNLSLNQELDHILSLNNWIGEHGDIHPPLNKCKVVDVRTIKMTYATAQRLRLASKFDRSASHFALLRDEGQAVAQRWLRNWRALGKDFATYPNDARYPEANSSGSAGCY